ncbi:SDR family NAD(P)-dependent oxidoreductase [Actinoplanes sp. NPDC023936]|uniref:type I polyketide synthase n=1 Tax=Actinoplanes sp. NPDC023936 TaxID=3154910 RepID=UPI0033DEF2AF
MEIAIVGMAAAFPGAGDTAAFWANLVTGTDAVTEVEPSRWDADRHYRAGDPRPGEHSPSKWGGFLAPMPFDPVAHGVPPAALGSVDPAQLLALLVAGQALADAGYDTREFPRDRTSVIFGAEAGADLATAYGARALVATSYDEPPAGLDEHLPRLTEDSFPGILSNVIAGRIANRLDLGGVNYTVDAACASSLTAVDLAVKELITGTSDMVLCGAVDVHNGLHDYLLFGSVQALSPTGRCRAFDESADGIVISEGVACLALKRLADAERDGDRVHAVIAGVGGASDGRAMGLTAPRAQGQRTAIGRALHAAGVRPAQIGLVEAHGTGTVVGDRTELSALSEVFAGDGAVPGSCSLGSVKSLIGHTKCAAGMAGLIKAVRAVQTGVRPPTGHLTRPNRFWEPATSPFTFDRAARPWLRPPAERVAGVSAFGFGGTNFHAVVRAHPSTADPEQAIERWPAELFLLRGTDAAADLTARAEAAGDYPGVMHALALEWFRHTSGDSRPVRAAVVAGDLPALRNALRRVAEGTADPAAGVHLAGDSPASLEVAFVFPGQGSQRPGMLADLFTAFPALRTELYQDPALAGVMFPPAAFGEADTAAQRDRLADTRHAQPALGVAGLALLDLLTGFGVRPDMAAGHSYGELLALYTSGVLSRSELLRLSRERAAAMHAAAGDGGGMVAVSAGADEVSAVLADHDPDGTVVIANHNGPQQVVIAGPVGSLESATEALRAAGHPVTRLAVSCAFHSPAMTGAATRFDAALAGSSLRTPAVPVWANVSGTRYPADPAEIRRLLTGQLAAPVRFLSQVEDMYAAGARVFVEVGPGRTLSRMISRILGDRPHVTVPCDVPGEPGLPRLLTALATLAAAGVPVDAGRLFSGSRAVAAPPPRRTGWTVDGHLVRGADGSPVPGGLRPADQAPRLTAASGGGSREATVLEFLRTSRELVGAQRDVMLGYLNGSAPAAPVTVPPDAPEEVALPATGDVPATIVRLLSERTGYPIEMLGPGLDLEAELGIDSIKRTELAQALLERLGVPAPPEGVGVLVAARTIAELTTLLDGVPAATPAVAGTPAADRAPLPPERYVPIREPVAAPAGASLAGQRIRLLGGPSDLAAALGERLARDGARITPDDDHADVAVLLADGGTAVPRVYAGLRPLLLAGVPEIAVVTTGDGAGLPGLVRAATHEYPGSRLRLLDLDPGLGLAERAGRIAEELTIPARGVFQLTGSARTIRRYVRQDLSPGDDELALDAGSVVLLTGGGRGITARTALALAARSGCHVELVGRTPAISGREDPATAGRTDPAELRRALLDAGYATPAEVERRMRELLAQRELRSVLDRLAASAASVRYHRVDVRDGARLAATVDDVYRRHGRIDVVVHGAGMVADRFIKDKDPDAFAAVYDAKVSSARVLLDTLKPDLRLLVLFSSVSGVFGNSGQADYAAANDALDALASAAADRITGRTLAVAWGPWAAAGGGMVSAALEREYARRGISVIDPEAGVEALLHEMRHGPRDTHQVMYLAGDPAPFRAEDFDG